MAGFLNIPNLPFVPTQLPGGLGTTRLTAVTVQPQLPPIRNVAGFTADAVIEEQHEDDLIITDHPVEQGSTVSDHAYKMPAQLTLVYIWSASSKVLANQDLRSMYQKLQNLQANRTLFQVFTGKRVYSNMMLRSLAVSTDHTSENILRVRMTCQEIILASTQTVKVPTNQANMTAPQITGPTISSGTATLGPAPNFNSAAGGKL